MKRTIAVITLSVLIVCFLLSYAGKNDHAGKKEDQYKPLQNESSFEEELDFNQSVWTVYWDLDNVQKEVQIINRNIKNISYFAAYFNSDNELIDPQELTEKFHSIESEFKENKWESYLTFVNDKINENGTSNLKDTKLLCALFSHQDDRQKHIDDIISYTLEGGYDGIEIDYEGIRKDIHLWNLFNDFTQDLYTKAISHDLKVRILLEPTTPFNQIHLTEGPDYVMMCYNLFGSHSGPGPKANKEFIQGLIEDMENVQGDKEFAIATGGFDWSSNGAAKQLTEKEATELAEKFDSRVERDENSQSIVFDYIDDKDSHHEVWYADNETLSSWSKVIQEAGDYSVSLWRLGGNVTLGN